MELMAPGALVTSHFDNPATGFYMASAVAYSEEEPNLWTLNDAYPGENPIRGGTMGSKVEARVPPDVPHTEPLPAIWELPPAPPQEWEPAQPPDVFAWDTTQGRQPAEEESES